jgi:DNA-binding MarR family transcriptional regulator
MDKVPVNRACRVLEDRGLAARRPNERDGRSHLLDLTAEGRAVHARIMPLAEAIEEELFGVLGESERAALASMLSRVRDGAGEFDPANLAE